MDFSATVFNDLLRQWEPREGSVRRRLLDRTPPFWRFQILGWLAWTIWVLPLAFGRYADIGVAVGMALSQEALGFLITLGLREVYRHSRLERFDVWGQAPAIVALSVAAAAANLLLAAFVQRLAGIDQLEGVAADYSGYAFCLRTALFVAWSALYFSVKGLLVNRENTRQLVEAERLRHEAELQMLRAQINPHFLFNAFNTILSEGKGNAKVVGLVKGLSDYLRYSLACRHEGFVSLGAEIDAVRSYLEVERARFQGDLELRIAVTQMARSTGVPGVIIQPLVENAIKHGRETSPHPLRLRIAAETGPRVLRIEVCNTGRWVEPQPFDQQAPSGAGLDNLRRRLAAIYPGRHRFEIGPRGDEVVALVEIEMDHDYDVRLQNYELRQRMGPS